MQKTLFGMLVLLLFTRVASAEVVAPARETQKIEGAHDSCGPVVFLRCNSADVDQTNSLRPPQASQSFTGSLASQHHFNRRVFIAGISLLSASKAADAITTRPAIRSRAMGEQSGLWTPSLTRKAIAHQPGILRRGKRIDYKARLVELEE